MANVRRFEDLDAWQKARILTVAIYRVSAEGGFGRDFALKNQIRRAAVSIMSNIAEGFDRRTDREFIQFLAIAKGSASEVRSQLYIALDVEFIDRQQYDGLMKMILDTSNLIGGLMRYLEAEVSKDKK